MSHEKMGNVAERGHLLAALDNFRAAHAIADRSAETDPRNASWQLDLAMPHDKIGDVLAQQNELAVALKSFSCVCANWLPATRRFRKTWPGSRTHGRVEEVISGAIEALGASCTCVEPMRCP